MRLLGIDVGGSGIKGAIVDSKKGKLISERFKLLTPRPANPKNVAKVIHEVVDHFEWKDNVGVCFPTVVKKGKAMSSSNMHKEWLGTRIDKVFEKECGNKFYVINDADAAAMAEMTHGAGKGKKGLIMTITIGTGLGSGVFFNGKLIPNFELGTLKYDKNLIIEKYAADSIRKKEDLSYAEWGRRFNEFLTHVENVMHPDLFILGGGASKKLDLFKDQLTVRTKYVPAKNRNNAGIIGAALFAKKKI